MMSKVPRATARNRERAKIHRRLARIIGNKSLDLES